MEKLISKEGGKMLSVKKLDHNSPVDELFAQMALCFQREYNREFEEVFQSKRKQLMHDGLQAIGLFYEERVIGYLEYEKTRSDKVAFYILYVLKGYRKVNIVTEFIKKSVVLLEVEGFQKIVAHLSPLRIIPLRKSMHKAGFSRYVRFEMSLALRYKETQLDYQIIPFTDLFSSELKKLMTRAFKDSIDYQIYSEFFNYPGQDRMLDKIKGGGYGPFLANCSPLMFDGKKIIGYGLVTAKGSDTSFLMDFAVDPEYQKSGLGKRLLSTIINLLIDSGYKYLTLAVTLENERAYKLYKKAGFKNIGKFEVFMYNSNIY